MPPLTALTLRRPAFRLPPNSTIRLSNTRLPALVFRPINHSPLRPSIIPIRHFSSSKPLYKLRLWEKSKEWLNQKLSLDSIRGSLENKDDLAMNINWATRQSGDRYPPHWTVHRPAFDFLMFGGVRYTLIWLSSYWTFYIVPFYCMTSLKQFLIGVGVSYSAWALPTIIGWVTKHLPLRVCLEPPAYARRSRSGMNHYLYNITPASPIIIVTANWYLRQKFYRVSIGDLTKTDRKFGYTNWVADLGDGKEMLFYMTGELRGGNIEEPNAWPEIYRAMEKYSDLKKQLGVPEIGKPGDEKWWDVMWEHWELEKPEPKVILPGVKIGGQVVGPDEPFKNESKYKVILERQKLNVTPIKVEGPARRVVFPSKSVIEAEKRAEAEKKRETVLRKLEEEEKKKKKKMEPVMLTKDYGKGVKKVVPAGKTVRRAVERKVTFQEKWSHMDD